MAYFDYKLDKHLLVPKAILDQGENLSHAGEVISSAPNPFQSSDMHLNFFNLAKSAIDNTARVKIIESLGKTTGSSEVGYVSYIGRQESAGAFYGGVAYNKVGSSVSTPVPLFPLIVPNSNASFKFAIGAGVNAGSLSSSNFEEITILKSEIDQITDIPHLNSLLIKDEFKITGDNDVSNNFSGTFGLINSSNPGSFVISINDGELVKTITLSTSFTLAEIVPTIQGALNSQIGSNKIIVSIDANHFISFTGNPNRDATEGCIKFELSNADDGLVPLLDLLGIDVGSYAYDLNSIITFEENEDGNVALIGVGPYSRFVLWNNATSGATLLNLLGITSYTNQTLLYHTVEPMSTAYTDVLNFGGTLKAKKIVAQDIEFVNAYFSDTTNFDDIEAQAGIITGNFEVQGALEADNLTTGAITSSGLATLSGNVVLGTDASSTLNVLGTTTFNQNVSLLSNKTLTVPNLIVSSSANLGSASLSLASLNTTGAITSQTNITASGNAYSTKVFASAPTSIGSGTAVFWDTGEFKVASSDKRLKDNIKPILDSTSIINSLYPVRYNYLEEHGGQEGIGFIAQELRKYIPEAVFGDEDKEMLSVNLDYIIPHLVRAFQEINYRLSRLETLP